MRKIAVISQKGGVGKTSTTISLAAGLSRKGKKVLILDLDAQGHIGVALQQQGVKDMYSFLIEGCDFRECVNHLGAGLDIVTSKDSLTKAEIILTKEKNRELILRNKLKEIKGYDYLLMDCSPSLGLLNQNAILAADEAIIPTSTDYLGYHALNKIISIIQSLNEIFEHSCKVTRIVPTMYDKRLNTCRSILSKMMDEFYGLVSDPIHVCSKLKEAPSKGQSIFKYAPSSTAAKDYMSLVWTVMRDENIPEVKEHKLNVALAKA